MDTITECKQIGRCWDSSEGAIFTVMLWCIDFQLSKCWSNFYIATYTHSNNSWNLLPLTSFLVQIVRYNQATTQVVGWGERTWKNANPKVIFFLLCNYLLFVVRTMHLGLSLSKKRVSYKKIIPTFPSNSGVKCQYSSSYVPGGFNLPTCLTIEICIQWNDRFWHTTSYSQGRKKSRL